MPTALVVEGKVMSLDGLPWIHLVASLTTLMPRSSGSSRGTGPGGPAARQACAAPQLPRGEVRVAKTCLQRAGQEAQGKRRSCFHLSSHLLLAFSPGIAKGQKRDGNLAKWKYIIVFSPPALHLISLLRKPGWTFFYPVYLTLKRLEIPFLLLVWQRLGNRFLSRGWVIWQKDKVRWGQGPGARVLPNSHRQHCEGRTCNADGEGVALGSTLSGVFCDRCS